MIPRKFTIVTTFESEAQCLEQGAQRSPEGGRRPFEHPAQGHWARSVEAQPHKPGQYGASPCRSNWRLKR